MPHGYGIEDSSKVSFGETKSPMDRIKEYMNIKKMQDDQTQINATGGGYMASTNNSIFGNGFA